MMIAFEELSNIHLVLDPYFANIIPQSLVSAIIYILVIAATAYPLSKTLYSWLCQIGADKYLTKPKK
jgi:hypothetical protein